MISVNLTVVLLVSWILCVYSEHRKLIPKCLNSCVGGPKSSNCFCDSKCSLIYNDCCLDAPYRSFRVNIKRIHNIHCHFVPGENKDFWMVDTCKDSWTGPEHIKSKCTAERHYLSESSDVTELVPVTSSREEVTYRNYYCGICNEDNPGEFVEWKVKALCSNPDVKPLDVLQNLTYVESKQQWGVWKTDAEGTWRFQECYLLFQRPSNITNGIRQCISNMVSTCPSSWRNIATRRRCKSYVDPIKWPEGPVYRNLDCAMCHNETVSGFQCVYDRMKDTSDIMLRFAMDVEVSAMGQWF